MTQDNKPKPMSETCDQMPGPIEQSELACVNLIMAMTLAGQMKQSADPSMNVMFLLMTASIPLEMGDA